MTEGGPRAHWRVRAQRVFGAARSGRQVGEWTDISPCREFIAVHEIIQHDRRRHVS